MQVNNYRLTFSNMNYTVETSIPGSENTLQCASPFLSKGGTPNKTVAYTLLVWHIPLPIPTIA